MQNISVSNLLDRLESLNVFYLRRNKKILWNIERTSITQNNQNSEKNENLAIIPFQSSTLLIENYSQNQFHYCLKYDLIRKRRNHQKQKRVISSCIESFIFNNDSYNIKLRMLHGGLKCKQLEEKIQSI